MTLVTLDPRSETFRPLPTRPRRSPLCGDVVARCCMWLTIREIGAWYVALKGPWKERIRSISVVRRCADWLAARGLIALREDTPISIVRRVMRSVLSDSSGPTLLRQIFYNTCANPGGFRVGLPLKKSVSKVLAITGEAESINTVVSRWGEEETDLFLELLKAQASASRSLALTTDTLGSILLAPAAAGNMRVVQGILQHGNVTPNTINLALGKAAENGHAAFVNALLATGVAGGVAQAGINLALVNAAGNGHSAIVNALLAKMVAGGIAQAAMDVALVNAAKNGHSAIVNALLATGGAVSVSPNTINLALTIAAERGHLAIVNALLAIMVAGGTAQRAVNAALIKAVICGQSAIVAALLATTVAGGVTPNMAAFAFHLAWPLSLTTGRKRIVLNLLRQSSSSKLLLWGAVPAILMVAVDIIFVIRGLTTGEWYSWGLLWDPLWDLLWVLLFGLWQLVI